MNKGMRYFNKLLILIWMVGLNLAVIAQSARDLRINEVLVKNLSNYEDNYGSRNAWIEVFNTAYNSVNIGGCYLTNDLSNPTKYEIPRNDPNTIIPSRFYTIFWADSNTTHGTFHLNFKLDTISSVIALYDADGRTLIDSVTIPNLGYDVSFGRTSDGDGFFTIMDKTTPKATNVTAESISAGQKFAKSDPSGLGMTIVAMSVVFLALILLYLFFRQIGKYNIYRQKKNVEAHAAKEGRTVVHEEVSGEVFAAISAAIYLYESEQHDYESTVLTINRVAKNYSPWSSKIYGLRNTITKR